MMLCRRKSWKYSSRWLKDTERIILQNYCLLSNMISFHSLQYIVMSYFHCHAVLIYLGTNLTVSCYYLYISVDSQIGLLAFYYLLLGDGVESLICALISWAMDGIGVHLINIGGEVRPGDESLTRPPVPWDLGIKHHGQLLLEKCKEKCKTALMYHLI